MMTSLSPLSMSTARFGTIYRMVPQTPAAEQTLTARLNKNPNEIHAELLALMKTQDQKLGIQWTDDIVVIINDGRNLVGFTANHAQPVQTLLEQVKTAEEPDKIDPKSGFVARLNDIIKQSHQATYDLFLTFAGDPPSRLH